MGKQVKKLAARERHAWQAAAEMIQISKRKIRGSSGIPGPTPPLPFRNVTSQRLRFLAEQFLSYQSDH